jgi:hypothetical protein
MKQSILIATYVTICLSLYPIGEFILHSSTDGYEDVSTFSYWFRLLLSGPLLILSGILLVSAFPRIHKVLGVGSIAIGVYWMISVFRDLSP